MTSTAYAHHFSERNVPFGIASSSAHPEPRPATRIQNTVIFLSALDDAGVFKDVDLPAEALAQPTLNQFASLPKTVHGAVRKAIQAVFASSGLDGFPAASKEDITSVKLHLPVSVGDFADFSCSLEHVKNAGRIIINDARPPPAFFNFPIGYSGRASSIVVSGTEIERPLGQFRNPDPATQAETPVVYGPSRRMDYELEFAAVIGKPLPMRTRLDAKKAEEHIFGFLVMNDWSSRDIQGFEMIPLGPFNGKSVGTTVSPWIVTLDALEPFRTSGQKQNAGLPAYLAEGPEGVTHQISMQVEVLTGGSKTATTVGKCNVQEMYWSVRQMVAHAVSSGSALRTGDMLATGTVSGPGEGALGCLLEVTEGGKKPKKMNDGSERAFLEDGDVVRMTAVAGGEDSGVGFGECIGELVPSRPFA